MSFSDNRGTFMEFIDRPVKAPPMLHYAHPKRLDKTWCGAEREPRPYLWDSGLNAECSVCADLQATLGRDGWLMGLPS